MNLAVAGPDRLGGVDLEQKLLGVDRRRSVGGHGALRAVVDLDDGRPGARSPLRLRRFRRQGRSPSLADGLAGATNATKMSRPDQGLGQTSRGGRADESNVERRSR
jgi:hypothetical protein